MNALDPDRLVGEEARKAHPERLRTGFIAAFLSGTAILDIGYRGYRDDVVPIVPNAIGIELDYEGYDGVTLPFPAGSQDAVFASHCLEHIEDYQNAIREWFRVLKVGGHLLIMVPHEFLYEKQTELPSRFNADHKRFYTPASLMAEIEASLMPNSYRLRHLVDNDFGYDYTIPPSQHSGGCYELELVIEKIEAPTWHLTKPPVIAKTPNPADALPNTPVPFGTERKAGGNDVARRDFGVRTAASPHILVLKLDHFGDFIIGLPSLQRLREVFSTGRITLVVGSWNKTAALASGLVDAVVTYDYFPQNALGWDGRPHERVEKFEALTAGRYDIAIDLRVDEDTRHLLTRVDAGLRCG
ncbi:MAG: methyltransferase domain-containing protein, partial [Oxalobacteraceae bacterium]